MSPFGIFSIVLIALYIIYYTVLIARDLHSQKGKGTGSDDEYEVTSMQQEVDTVGVEESAEGFTIGGQRKGPDNNSVTGTTYKPKNDDKRDDEGNEQKKNERDGVSKGASRDEKQSEKSERIQKKIEQTEENMEATAPQGNVTFSKSELERLITESGVEGSLFR